MDQWKGKSRDAKEIRSEKSKIMGKVISCYLLSIEILFYLNDVYYTRSLINIFIFFSEFYFSIVLFTNLP